jgi:hypothetical protein
MRQYRVHPVDRLELNLEILFNFGNESIPRRRVSCSHLPLSYSHNYRVQKTKRFSDKKTATRL